MFYILISRIPFIYNIDDKKEKIFRTFFVGSICYIILHGLLYSKKFLDNSFIEKYRKYLLYVSVSDFILTCSIVYLVDKGDNKNKKELFGENMCPMLANKNPEPEPDNNSEEEEEESNSESESDGDSDDEGEQSNKDKEEEDEEEPAKDAPEKEPHKKIRNAYEESDNINNNNSPFIKKSNVGKEKSIDNNKISATNNEDKKISANNEERCKDTGANDDNNNDDTNDANIDNKDDANNEPNIEKEPEEILNDTEWPLYE